MIGIILCSLVIAVACITIFIKREDFVKHILQPRWIVSLEERELGFRIFGVNCWYFKWEDPMIENAETEQRPWRFARKREFGEVITSQLE